MPPECLQREDLTGGACTRREGVENRGSRPRETRDARVQIGRRPSRRSGRRGRSRVREPLTRLSVEVDREEWEKEREGGREGRLLDRADFKDVVSERGDAAGGYAFPV